jgi:Spy/CpxP family protein refolding chaperone
MLANGLRTGLLIVTAAASLSALAGCGRHHSPEQKAEWVVSKISKKLELTADQKTKLESVKQAYLDVWTAHKDDRAKRLDEVKQMILSDRLDAAKVKSLMGERRKIEDDNFDPVFAKLAEFHASLTPQQKGKIAAFLDKVAKRLDQK